MSIADTATGTTAHDRTFWRADYARFARAIRRTRHTRDGLTAKSAEHQARCDELAGVVAALFRADAPGAFSGESSALAPRSLARCPATGTARTTPRNGATPTLRTWTRTRPAGPENRVTRCDLGVFADQAAERSRRRTYIPFTSAGRMRTTGGRVL